MYMCLKHVYSSAELNKAGSMFKVFETAMVGNDLFAKSYPQQYCKISRRYYSHDTKNIL